MLEGPRGAVLELFAKIKQDTRHSEIEMETSEAAMERSHDTWMYLQFCTTAHGTEGVILD